MPRRETIEASLLLGALGASEFERFAIQFTAPRSGTLSRAWLAFVAAAQDCNSIRRAAPDAMRTLDGAREWGDTLRRAERDLATSLDAVAAELGPLSWDDARGAFVRAQ